MCGKGDMPLRTILDNEDFEAQVLEKGMKARQVCVGDIQIGGFEPLVVMAGPCHLESLDHARMLAERIAEACSETRTKFIFKDSFDKANRSSLSGKQGPGIYEGLSILQHIRNEFGVPVVTDVHETSQCPVAAEVCDALQIPAFLRRQTDLVLAEGETGRTVNIKKGQFLAPWKMKNVANKVASTGNHRTLQRCRGRPQYQVGGDLLP